MEFPFVSSSWKDGEGVSHSTPETVAFPGLAPPSAPSPAASLAVWINAHPLRCRGSFRDSTSAPTVHSNTQPRHAAAVTPTGSHHICAQEGPRPSSTAGPLRNLLVSALPHALKSTNRSRLEELLLFNVLKLFLCPTKEANREAFAQTPKLLRGRFGNKYEKLVGLFF